MSRSPSTPPARSYRARTGERTFDVALSAHALTVDGREVDVTFERVDERFFTLIVDGRSLPAVIETLPDGRLRVTLAGRQIDVDVQDEKALLMERFGLADAASAGVRELRAPMPGLVLSIAVEVGQAVQAGDGLLVLEAMKMENELRAEAGGTVKAVHIQPGDAVGKGALLIEFAS